MKIEIPTGGVTAKFLCEHLSDQKEDVVLQTVAAMIQDGRAHLKGDLIMPGKRQIGRPTEKNPRVPITVRLPSDMVDWLRERGKYTKIIEDLLRVEIAKQRRFDFKDDL